MIRRPQPRLCGARSFWPIWGAVTRDGSNPWPLSRTSTSRNVRPPSASRLRGDPELQLHLVVGGPAVLEGVDAGLDDGHLHLVDLVAAELHPLPQRRDLRRCGDLHLRGDRNGEVDLSRLGRRHRQEGDSSERQERSVEHGNDRGHVTRRRRAPRTPRSLRRGGASRPSGQALARHWSPPTTRQPSRGRSAHESATGRSNRSALRSIGSSRDGMTQHPRQIDARARRTHKSFIFNDLHMAPDSRPQRRCGNMPRLAESAQRDRIANQLP